MRVTGVSRKVHLAPFEAVAIVPSPRGEMVRVRGRGSKLLISMILAQRRCRVKETGDLIWRLLRDSLVGAVGSAEAGATL
jgi:hypothetical protein